MTIFLIIGIICLIGLAYLTSKEKWDNNTRPPKGWIQNKGFRIKQNK
jgi:hypothetical protein